MRLWGAGCQPEAPRPAAARDDNAMVRCPRFTLPAAPPGTPNGVYPLWYESHRDDLSARGPDGRHWAEKCDCTAVR